MYESTLGGDCENWLSTGASSPYNSSATGFRIYVHQSTGSNLSPAIAAGCGWFINWVAIGN